MPRSYSAFLLRVAAEQRVAARAGVGVDEAVALLLRAEVAQHEHQDDVLEHVGVVAGVEGVAVGEHQPRPVRVRNSSHTLTSRGPATTANASPAPIVPGSRTREIAAAPGALGHQLGRVPEAQRGVELEARQARRADRERAFREAQHVADEEIGLDDAGRGEVLAERARRQRLVPERDSGLRADGLPERVVLARIRVDRPARAAVDAQVGLLVAFDAERQHRARARRPRACRSRS